MEIPFGKLSPEALRGLLEEFVTRDGTDYGAVERTLEEKVAGVRRQLERGEVAIVFEAATGSCNVVARETLATRQGRQR